MIMHPEEICVIFRHRTHILSAFASRLRVQRRYVEDVRQGAPFSKNFQLAMPPSRREGKWEERAGGMEGALGERAGVQFNRNFGRP